MYKLVCQYCKITFERNRKTPKYCSKKCAYDDRVGKPRHPNAGRKRTKKPEHFICKYCNQPFERFVNPSTKERSTFEFCSPICRNKARQLDKIPCPTCGKLFKPQVHMMGGIRKKHCSKKCGDKDRIQRSWPLIEIEEDIAENYPHLGPDYFMEKYDLTREYVCGIANRQGIKLNPDEYRKRVHGAARKYMSSPNNPNWQGGVTCQEWGEDWQVQRKKALKRDKYKCQVCFKKGKVVHHIKPRRLFDDSNINDMNKLSNLITLCDKHHVPVEIGKIQCPHPMGD